MATRNKGLYTRDARQKAGRITAAVFILVAAVIAVVVLRRVQGEADGRASNARRLIEAFRAGAARGYARTMSNPPLWPDASTAESAGADADADEAEPLAVDIDGDSFQDRVSIVPEKDGGAVIVFERYNGTLYTRIAEASVPIEAKTAALAAMDMTGDHKMEVVCQGSSSGTVDGRSGAAMQVFSYKDTGQSAGTIKQIGAFRAASVYIDIVDRTEAYNQSQAAGEPFHVWTYVHEGNNEVRTEWTYSTKEDKYIIIGEKRVAQTKAERTRGQATAEFLNGLWVRTESTDGDRFIYFDRKAHEIIFAYQDTQELYIWGDNRLRGGGAVITTVNSAIKTMKRRCDITVMGTDEIRLRASDAVRIVPNGVSSWDGTYRRMKAGSRLPLAAITD